MNLRVEAGSGVASPAILRSLPSAWRRVVDFVTLTKPRVVLMVLVTTAVGYRLGSVGTSDWVRLLQTLAGTGRFVEVEVQGPVTQRAVLDALESAYPALLGTIRDQTTKKRRPLLRFFACEEDWSDAALDDPLPDEVASGKEPFLVIGAIAGG